MRLPPGYFLPTMTGRPIQDLGGLHIMTAEDIPPVRSMHRRGLPRIRRQREERTHHEGRRPACEEIYRRCGHQAFVILSGRQPVAILPAFEENESPPVRGDCGCREADLYDLGHPDEERGVQVPSGGMIFRRSIREDGLRRGGGATVPTRRRSPDPHRDIP